MVKKLARKQKIKMWCGAVKSKKTPARLREVLKKKLRRMGAKC